MRFWFRSSSRWFFISFLSLLEISAAASQSLIPPESWIDGVLEENAIQEGRAYILHTLPLTPRQNRVIVRSLLEADTKLHYLAASQKATLSYALGLRGLNPQLVRQPLLSVLNTRDTLGAKNRWILSYGGNVNGEIDARSSLANPYLTRYEQRKPLMSLDVTANYDTFFYACVQSVWKNDWPVYLHEVRDSNIPRNFLNDLDLRNFYKAYLYYDDDWIDFMIGRDNFRWGVGERGTLLLSDNVPYFDMIRLSAGSLTWRLTSLFSELTDYEPQFKAPGQYTRIDSLFKPPRFMFAHRLEFIPWRNLNVGITELTIIFGRYPDLGDLNPLIIGHNLFKEYENSLGEIDATYYLFPGISIYGDLGVDDISLGTKTDDSNRPTSLAYQIGARAVRYPVVLTAEYTMIDKWFYNYPYDPYGRPLEIQGSSYMGTPYRDIRIIPVGQWLPPDSRSWLVSLRTSYSLPYLFKISYEQRNHGEVDINTKYLDPRYVNQDTPTGVVEKSDIVTLQTGVGYWQLYLGGKVMIFRITNYQNQTGIRRNGEEYQAALSFYF